MNFVGNAEMTAGPAGALDGWSLRMWDGLETVGEMGAVKEDGRQALKLAWKLGAARFGAEAALAESMAGPVHLRFAAQVKTSGEGRAALLLEALDAKGGVAAQAESSPASAAKWTPVALDFAAPAGARSIRATCLNVGPGDVFFSQVSLSEAAPEAAATAVSFPLQAISQPAEGNAIWAGGQPVFNTFVDSPCSLTFSFWGRGSDLSDPAFVIETPEAVKVAELFNTHSGIRKAETPEVSVVNRDGRPHRRHVYRNPAVFGIVQPRFAWNRELTAALLPASPDAAGKDFDVFWWMESGGARSPAKRVIVRFLPPMATTPNPKRFGYGGWGKEDLCFNDPALLAMALKKYEEANMAGAPRGGPDYHRVDDLMVSRGWTMKTGEPDYMHAQFLPFLAAKPELAKRVRYVVSDRGKERKDRVCPSFFIEDAEFGAGLRAFVAEKLSSRRVRDGEMVSMDIEPWGTFEWCFCQRCRERFAKETGLKETPDTAAIINRFRKEWRDYRTRECEAVHRLVAGCVRQHNPKLVIADYNYPMWYNRPGFESLFDNVGKDPRRYEDVIDAHLPSFYHYNKKEAFDLIDVVRRALKKPVWMTPSISRADAVNGSWTSRSETLSPKAFRQKMLGAAASGCAGVMVYPGDHLDGLFFVEIDRGMAWIAAVEDFYMDGRREDEAFRVEGAPLSQTQATAGGKSVTLARPAWPNLMGWRVHELKGQRLLTVFNFHDFHPLYATAAWPGAKGETALVDPANGRLLTPDARRRTWTAKELADGFLVFAEPEGTAFVVARPPQAGDEKLPIVTQQEWRDGLKAARAKEAGQAETLKPVSGEGLAIALDDVDGDGVFEVLLSGPRHRAWVAAADGGKLSEWEAGGRRLVQKGQSKPNLEGLAWDLFWEPRSLRWTGAESEPYKVLGAEIRDGRAVLRLEKTLSAPAAVMTKTYELARDTAAIRVLHTIRNTSKESIRFSFWSHGFPKLGPADQLMDNMAILVPVASGGVKTIRGRASGDNVFWPQGQAPLGFDAGRGEPMSKPRVGVVAVAERFGLVYDLTGAQLGQVYLYRCDTPTVEWMSEMATLAPGQTWQSAYSMTFVADADAASVEKTLDR